MASSSNISHREGAKKCWCFTLNNYTNELYIELQSRLIRQSKYAIIGEEISPSTQTPHLQGYVSFNKRVRFAGAKSIIGSTAHIESARGSPRQNREYCSKDRRIWEHGTLPGPSRGSSIDDSPLHNFAEKFHEAIKARSSLEPLLEESPLYMLSHAHKWIQSYNSIISLHPPDRKSVLCIWLYGPTGTGKSTYAHKIFSHAYVKDPSNIWWDGYMQQTEVIVEDFGFTYPPITNLLWWFSHFKCRVQTKGGHTALFARKFIVTSNYSIETIFNAASASNHTEAIKRRFKQFDISQGTNMIDQAILEFDAADTFDINAPLSVRSDSSVWQTLEEDDSSTTTIQSDIDVMAQPL